MNGMRFCVRLAVGVVWDLRLESRVVCREGKKEKYNQKKTSLVVHEEGESVSLGSED
jgi:hypothetical protein